MLPNLFEIASIRASTHGCRCSLALIDEFDAEFLAALRGNSDIASLRFSDIEFTIGSGLAGAPASPTNAIRNEPIRVVAFCFRARLRHSLAYVLDALELPVDGAYFKRDRAPDFPGDQGVDTLLAACIRRLSFRVDPGTPLPPPATMERIARAHLPYFGILQDLLARGASSRLLQQPGGDYFCIKPDALRKSRWAGEPRDALLRAALAYLTQPAGFEMPFEVIRVLAAAAAPKVRVQLAQALAGWLVTGALPTPPAARPQQAAKVRALWSEWAGLYPETQAAAVQASLANKAPLQAARSVATASPAITAEVSASSAAETAVAQAGWPSAAP